MRPPLILLHGALGSERQYDSLKQLLADDFIVHTFTFSGHGGLPITGPFSITGFEREVMDFIASRQMERADLFGYSMGGYVALQSALHHPSLVGRVMTLGTKMQWDPESAAKEVKMLDPEIIEQKVPAFAGSLAQRHAPAEWKANMLATATMMTDLGNGLALTENELRQVTNDVMMCLGELDTMVTAAETQWAVSHIPNAQFRQLPGCKHPIEAVDPGLLAEEILTYFLSA